MSAKNLIIKNISLEHLADLNSIPELKTKRSTQNIDNFFIDANLLDLFQAQRRELTRLNSLKLTSLLFNNTKERIILLYLADLDRICSFQSICKEIFDNELYNEHFQSKSNAVITYNLKKLIDFGLILKIDKGIYSISDKGKVLAEMLKDVI